MYVPFSNLLLKSIVNSFNWSIVPTCNRPLPCHSCSDWCKEGLSLMVYMKRPTIQNANKISTLHLNW
uniref:Uncharacterized protein n=1 Tax=Trichuris muris TaxID=70415 RepID=A0A5S6Q761_TRIMR